MSVNVMSEKKSLNRIRSLESYWSRGNWPNKIHSSRSNIVWELVLVTGNTCRKPSEGGEEMHASFITNLFWIFLGSNVTMFSMTVWSLFFTVSFLMLFPAYHTVHEILYCFSHEKVLSIHYWLENHWVPVNFFFFLL